MRAAGLRVLRRKGPSHDRSIELGQPLAEHGSGDVVWPHFRRTEGGASCVHCGFAFVFDVREDWPTGNARRHLIGTIHSAHTASPIIRDPSLVVRQRRIGQAEERRARDARIHELVAELIAKDAPPFSLVESPRFRALMQLLRGPICSRKTATMDVISRAEVADRAAAAKLV